MMRPRELMRLAGVEPAPGQERSLASRNEKFGGPQERVERSIKGLERCNRGPVGGVQESGKEVRAISPTTVQQANGELGPEGNLG